VTEQSQDPKDAALAKLRELAEEWRRREADEDAAEEAAKASRALKLDAGKKMLDLMDAVGMQNAKFPGIGTVYVTVVISPKVAPERKQEMVAWLKADPTGKALVAEQYQAQSLSKFLRERMEDGGEMPPADLVDPLAWTERQVRLKKA
jgi:hypothetical protein